MEQLSWRVKKQRKINHIFFPQIYSTTALYFILIEFSPNFLHPENVLQQKRKSGQVKILRKKPFTIIVPTLLRGEELYTQMGFFCSVNFDRSIYSLYRVASGINKKPLQRRIWN